MAGNGIGFSFAPGSEQIPIGNRQVNGGPQSAVEVKSFTLPNRFVPGQIAPQALLQSHGGGGLPDVDILRRLMQVFAPQGMQPGVPSLTMPPRGPEPPFQTLPVPMEPQPQAPPLQAQPVPNPNQDVPQTPTMPAPPRVIPGDTERLPVGPPAPPETPYIAGFDLQTPSGGFQSPLGRDKYQGFSF